MFPRMQRAARNVSWAMVLSAHASRGSRLPPAGQLTSPRLSAGALPVRSPDSLPARLWRAPAVLGLLLLAAVLLSSCGRIFGSPFARTGEEGFDSENAEQATPTPLPSNARVIYMLGRSVTGLWFSHWGWQGDPETPVVRGKYVLFRREIDTPENMVSSARAVLSEIPDSQDPTIQWKFCFDDFSGAEDAQSSIQRNEQITQQIYQIVVEQHHHRLIIGNALPKVALDSDPELVAAQRQYNQWLAQFAQSHSGQVFIFDQYNILADANGILRSAYATARDDSHPNEAGYRALDAQYVRVLDTILR